MMTLVTGGCGSGKSEYAEALAAESGCPNRWYVATMEVYGKEGKRKVERHRRQRAGKGFRTIESPRELDQVRIPGGPEGTAVLLECVSNLAANEMFGGEAGSDCGGALAGPAEVEMVAGPVGEEMVAGPVGEEMAAGRAGEAVVAGVRSLARQAETLVVVTNEVGADGISYEKETAEYIRLMGRINCRLAELADRVVEVVYGIPVVLKENAVAAEGGKL